MGRFLHKYSPRRFSDYLAFERIRPVVTGIVEEDSYHGILIAGESGMGKSTLAKILIDRMNCESPHGIEPCVVCKRCQQREPEHMHAMVEWNVVSGAGITKPWVKRLYRDLIVQNMWFRRHVFVDDIDEANPEVVATLKLPLDDFYNVPMIFTASDLGKLPPPFVQRMIIVRLEKQSVEDVMKYAESICRFEGIRVDEPEAMLELVKRANRNYRNVLNILEVIKDLGECVTLSTLSHPIVLDNVGLQVGSKRYVAVS